MEQASGQVLGLDAQGNMLFRLVKPVMGIFHHTTSQQEQSNSMGQVGMTLQGLADNTMVQVHHGQQVHDVQVHHGQQVQDQMAGSEVMTQTHLHVQSHMQPHMEAHIMQVSDPGAVQQSTDPCMEDEEEEEDMMPASLQSPQAQQVTHMPFAEVSSLLDPNMKGSKARKYLISYDEIKRRLQSPEKMSLRSLAAYTRVSRGPASKKSLLESLTVLGLTPSTTTAVSSSFSKLTEGDTKALCADMKDFAHDYVDYGSMAKQLIPETNTVQHWSKIIETKNHLEDMRKCFRDPLNSGAFHSVTHGLGLGMLDVALDMVGLVIDRQVRILSGVAANDPADPGPPMRRVRRRHRKPRPCGGGDNGALDAIGDIIKLHRTTSGGGVAVGAKTTSAAAKVIGGRGRGGRSRKKVRLDGGAGAGGSRSATATAATAAGMAVGGGGGGPSQMMTMTTVSNSKAGEEEEETMENSVLTLVSVGYEAISTGLSLTTTQSAAMGDT